MLRLATMNVTSWSDRALVYAASGPDIPFAQEHRHIVSQVPRFRKRLCQQGFASSVAAAVSTSIGHGVSAGTAILAKRHLRFSVVKAPHQASQAFISLFVWRLS